MFNSQILQILLCYVAPNKCYEPLIKVTDLEVQARLIFTQTVTYIIAIS